MRLIQYTFQLGCHFQNTCAINLETCHKVRESKTWSESYVQVKESHSDEADLRISLKLVLS